MLYMKLYMKRVRRKRDLEDTLEMIVTDYLEPAAVDAVTELKRNGLSEREAYVSVKRLLSEMSKYGF